MDRRIEDRHPLEHLYISVSIILKHGPLLEDSVNEFVLSDSADFAVKYVRRRKPIRVMKTVDGVVVANERIEPPGVLVVERQIRWSLPAERFDATRHEVHLNASEAGRLEDHISETVQAAVAAFEIVTDSTVIVHGREATKAVWRDADGIEFSYQVGSVEMINYPVSVLGDRERQRYSDLLQILVKPAHADVLAAYSVSRLNPLNFSAQSRVVFAWSLLERVVKTLHGPGRLLHRRICEIAQEVCRDEIARATSAPFTVEHVIATLESAYQVRNGLAHGQRAPTAPIDFPALSYATTLLCRRLT